MSISIKQKKKKSSWINTLFILVFIFVVFTGSYFLFFKKPELVEVVVPGRFKEISEFSEIEFNPQKLLNSPEFKVLRQFQFDVQVSTPGKDNPFMP